MSNRNSTTDFSKKLADKLLQGWAMLDIQCSNSECSGASVLLYAHVMYSCLACHVIFLFLFLSIFIDSSHAFKRQTTALLCSVSIILRGRKQHDQASLGTFCFSGKSCRQASLHALTFQLSHAWLV